jgi:23S rRNA pseudouridine2605 synthase
VPLERLLSKRGVASRTEAQALIEAGRVEVNGRLIRRPLTRVPTTARIRIDGHDTATDVSRRVIALNKPRGTVTTRHDPDGRQTVFDVLGEAGRGLIAVGRLDRASTGLLLFTTDTALAAALTDPAQAILRRYVVTVRGRVDPEIGATLERGLTTPGPRGPEALRAVRVIIQKASGRETHLLVDLDEGKNREIRRLFDAVGHEVTRLHRVAFGAMELGTLQPGTWREVTETELTVTLGRASEASARPRATTRRPHRPPARIAGNGSAASNASARGGSRSR